MSLNIPRCLKLVAKAAGDVRFDKQSLTQRIRNLESCQKDCSRSMKSTTLQKSFLMVPLLTFTVQTDKTNFQTLKDLTKAIKCPPKPNFNDIKKMADNLHRKHKMVELYALLKQYDNCDDADIQWRLARAAWEKGKRIPDMQERKALTFEAFESAKKALERDPNNPNSHKWYAILLDQAAQYKGVRARLGNIFIIKKHFEKAIELNPKDAVSLHAIGFWYFTMADLTWYERKIIAVLFSSPPKSSYEEALCYFERAEQADPKFYAMNLVMLGKTHLRLGHHERASQYLTEAYSFPTRTPEDELAHKEASQLLRKLGHCECVETI